MAGVFQVEVRMPVLRDRWRPAMVAAVTEEPMVEVHLERNRVRVRPGYTKDSRVQLFLDACDCEGIDSAITNWTEIRREWNRWRSDWGQRAGLW